jgi:hypothetical protein
LAAGRLPRRLSVAPGEKLATGPAVGDARQEALPLLGPRSRLAACQALRRQLLR